MIRPLMPQSFETVAQTGRKNRMVLLVFATGAVIALHMGLLHLFLWRNPAALLIFVAPSFLFSGTVYALWRWVFPRFDGRPLMARLALQTLVSLVALLAVSLLTVDVASLLIGGPPLFGVPHGTESHLIVTPELRQLAVRMYALLPVVPTALIGLIGYHQFWSRILSLQDRERQLTELAATAQLAALRAQINPHFLFNSLNSIAQLIHADPDKAEACVERLAEMFRYILRRAEKDFVPLADELEMAQAYLDIERARFGDRLRVETHVDPRSLRHLIPNLVLQPLVENAVKHGLSRKMGAGTVHIDAAVRDGCLDLAVRDDGLGMALAVLDDVYERGVGLRNLRDRLERLYGPAHLPEIRSAPGGGTEVRLRLPVKPVGVAA